jgi:hypothetical protein
VKQVAVLSPPRTARWWREVLYILAFYAVYTAIRDTQGSAGRGQTAPSTTAFRHARSVIHVERDLVLFHEQQIQHFFLSHLAASTSHFFEFWDLWYGSAHFIVTAAVVVWLFRRRPASYAYWRNTLAITTAFALVGFTVFPLMPPRLLPATGYGFVDTLARFGGSWSFDSGAVNKVSNQFAAMPSLHIAWSLWSAFALYPACRRWWTKALTALYPVMTLFCVVVTGNHYFLDAVGGAVIFAAGSVAARPLTAWMQSRLA